ncbi:YhdP family protein [Spectribacter hydrogenoxidans]|uniref:YhdP family protein n=1 Tax=Spectribacter hydrogenoxidans TaxID=3075608 RepID=A0ABU3BZ15_9GAMM|nr:YhdP family protein [Salinisphaera sp. W335]MDT0634552.1 YhdP family protein [Salinisphaera sp. W335]
MRRRNLRLKTLLLVTLASLVIVAGLAVGAVRLIDRTLPGYRAELTERIGEELEQPLTIGRLGLAWDWTGPVLELSDVALLESAGGPTVVRLEQLAVRFSFVDLLRGGRIPRDLTLVGPQLAIYRGDDGGLRLRGLASGGGSAFSLDDAATWLDRVDRIRVRDGQLGLAAGADSRILGTLDDVELTLRSHDSRHRVIGDAKLPPAWGDHVHADVFAYGDLTRWRDLAANAYIRLGSLTAPELLSQAGLETADLEGGHSDVELWVDWADRALDGARATAVSEAIRGRDASPVAPPLRMDFNVEPDAEGYAINLESLRADDRPVEATGRARVNPALTSLNGEITDLPASLAAAAARVGLPGARQLTGQGSVSRLSFRMPLRTPGQTRGLVAFEDLALDHAGLGLELGRIDGQATLGPEGATLAVEKLAGSLTWQRYVRGELPLTNGRGKLSWSPDSGGGGTLHLADARLTSGQTTFAGGGELTWDGNGGAPRADLTFTGDSADLPPLFAHLPQANDMPNKRLRDWLPRAITAARVTSAEVRLAGPLSQFPFAAGNGEFRVSVVGEDVDMAYKPGWPAMQDIEGQLTLVGDTLDIQASRGRILGVEVGPASAHVPNVREPVLAVDGRLDEAGADAMMRFIPASPLADKFGRIAEVLEVSGPAGLTLALSLPLKPDLDADVAVDGTIDLRGVTLTHPALPRPLQGLDGDLRFDLKGLYAQGIEGRFMGMPVQADLTPAGADGLAIDARADLSLPAQAPWWEPLLPADLVARADGSAVWQAGLRVSAGGRISDLRLHSDLTDLALDLPAPLGKPAGTSAPLSVTVSADSNRITLDYADRLRAELRRTDDRLQAADLVFGTDPVNPPAGDGLWVGGHLAELDLPAWQALLPIGGDRAGPGLALRGGDLTVDRVRLQGQAVPTTRLRVTPLPADRGWQADLSGDGAAGNVRWETGNSRPTVHARLDHLALLPAARTEPTDDQAATDAPMDPGQLPGVDLAISELWVDGTSLGRLTANARAIDNGVALEELSLNGNDTHLTGQGQWTRTGGQSQATLDSTLEGSGLARLIQALGFSPSVRADKARVVTALRFEPSAAGLVPERLNGHLSFKLEDGTLVPIEPGAGRVLGLVNFYALPRRLLLDFRDVLNEGMAFDRLQGDFNVTAGDARTDNLRINTPSAIIRIRGRVGLAARDYDQRVTIVPKMSSAAAIAGTVLGGPAVGAALFVAQRLLRKPIAEISSVTYDLTGQWSDPQIDPVEEATQE